MPVRRNVLLLYAISFLQGMVFYVSISILYRQVCGVSVFQIMLIESISLWLSMALELPWGVVADRIGYKKVMVACTFLLFFSKYIFYIADNFWLFLLERVILAFVISGLSGVDSSLMYLSCGEERSQRAFGVRSSLNSAGLFLATAVFAALPEDSYRLSALLTTFTYGLSAILTLFLTEVKSKPEKRSGALQAMKQAANNLRHTPGMIPLLIMSVLFFEVVMNITGFFRQPQFVRCGAGSRMISIALLIGSVCEMSGALSERLTKLLGEKLFGTGIIVLCAAGCFAMALTTNLCISIAAVSFMCAAGVLLGALTDSMENRMVVSEDRATMLSLNSMFTGIMAAPLNLGLGCAVDVNLPASFIICGILLLCSGFLFLKTLKAVK